MRYALAAGIVFALSACGTTAAKPTPTTLPTFNVRTLYPACSTALGPILTKLHEADSRLSVGLSYSAYTTLVGDIKVAYDQVPISTLTPDCLSGVGVFAEDAMNRYTGALTTWSACIGDINCSTDSIQPQLQANWLAATGFIQQADAGMAKLKAMQ
jgi:hypothetical protein